MLVESDRKFIDSPLAGLTLSFYTGKEMFEEMLELREGGLTVPQGPWDDV
jgi:hypothetical protein